MKTHHKPSYLATRLVRAFGDAIAPRGKGGGRLCIVNYHRILESPDPLLESEPDIHTFRWQMELLAECFNVMPLQEAVQSLFVERMPPRAVCITFDDGYRSTHDLALPILKECGLPATVFVTTGHMEKGSMWNDIILEAVRKLTSDRLDLREIGLDAYSLRTPDDRKLTAHTLTESIKYMLPNARLELTRTLETLAGTTLQQELMLTREMICTLARNNVEIGGHTITHPILTRIDDAAARNEIEGNKQQLEAIIGKPVSLFAYPNGKAGIDYDRRHVQMVRDAGYVAAFTTAVGAATQKNDHYELPRSRPWDAGALMFSGRLLQWLMGKNA